MSGGIFLIGKDRGLVKMPDSPYDSEDLLQRLLADYPDLLAGNQMDDANPRRWLLISREAAVPSSEDSTAQWSLDHLSIDQDSVPTLIEVKRSSDTRIRREVIGQMLDYAANAVAYWPIESIQAMLESNCTKNGTDSVQVLDEFLEGESAGDEFWENTKPV